MFALVFDKVASFAGIISDSPWCDVAELARPIRTVINAP
jgi:hypothetical protein